MRYDDLYLPLADAARIYNGLEAKNSQIRAIALKKNEKITVRQPDLWHIMLRQSEE